jgi:hypothetical protein
VNTLYKRDKGKDDDDNNK